MLKPIFSLTFMALALAASATLVPTRVINDFDAARESLDIQSLSAIGEARLGSRTVGGSTYELDTQDFTNGGSLTTAQRAWTNGQFESFTLAYTAATRNVNLTVGGVSVATNLANATSFDSVFIRVFAQQSNDLTATVKDLALTQNFGSGVETRGLQDSSLASPTGGFDANAIQLSGLSASEDFTLSGKLAFGWVNPNVALNSRGAVQFKIAEATNPVPEPASMAALGLGALALLRRRKA